MRHLFCSTITYYIFSVNKEALKKNYHLKFTFFGCFVSTGHTQRILVGVHLFYKTTNGVSIRLI